MNGWGAVYSEEEKDLLRKDLVAMNEEARKMRERSPKAGLHPRVTAIIAKREAEERA